MNVFVPGGSRDLGRPLVAELLGRGYSVAVLVRPGSEEKLPEGAQAVAGKDSMPVPYREVPEILRGAA